MTRALYIVGEPGVGKTVTLAAMFEAEPDSIHAPDPAYPLVRAERLAGRDGLRLGEARDLFGGTDALSMGVQPQAIKWLQAGALPPLLIGEGARLGTPTFLRALAAATILTVVHLTADPWIVDERRLGREAREQAPAFRRGRRMASWEIAMRTTEWGADVILADSSDVDVPTLAAGLRRAFLTAEAIDREPCDGLCGGDPRSPDHNRSLLHREYIWRGRVPA